MRKLTLVASSAIAAIVLTGCGGNDANQSNQGNQNNGGNGQVASSLKLLAEDLGKKSSEKSTAHMVFKAEAAGQTIEGSGDVKLGSQPAMQMDMGLPGMGQMAMRLVDDVFYVKLPQEVQPGKSWVRIDPNGTDPASKALAASLKQMKEQGDPSQMLKQLEGAGEITGSKQEDLNGKPTTHYTVTVDVNKAAQQSGMEEMIGAARQAGITTIPLDVWVDQESLPVRIAMEMNIKDPSQPNGQQVPVKFSVDYTDWGKPVNVAAPPPAEVGQLPQR